MYKIVCEDSSEYAGKAYFRHNLDTRDRLQVEYFGLKFLHENRVADVPKPKAVDAKNGLAVYQFIRGRRLDASEIRDTQIDFAINFLRSLKHVKDALGSQNLPNASEAVFSVTDLIENIRYRFKRLSDVSFSGESYEKLSNFLRYEFEPALKKIESWSKALFNPAPPWVNSQISLEQRTLSPSDFGFHNALQTENGRLIFLDFEYFGWDDPAKMISDFLLHPALELAPQLKSYFYSQMLEVFEEQRDLEQRIRIYYPLLGLKWCTILLNEFIHEHLARRCFAENVASSSARQAKQIEKAKSMLEKVLSEYEVFPY